MTTSQNYRCQFWNVPDSEKGPLKRSHHLIPAEHNSVFQMSAAVRETRDQSMTSFLTLLHYACFLELDTRNQGSIVVCISQQQGCWLCNVNQWFVIGVCQATKETSPCKHDFHHAKCDCHHVIDLCYGNQARGIYSQNIILFFPLDLPTILPSQKKNCSQNSHPVLSSKSVNNWVVSLYTIQNNNLHMENTLLYWRTNQRRFNVVLKTQILVITMQNCLHGVKTHIQP